MNDIAFSVIINNNGIDDIIFKTIMLKGEKGNSVDHVEKTSTSGLVDTYTIYLSDGTVGGTFTVTNGAPVNIDDSVIALDKTWSSSKLSGMIKSIDDTTVDADKLWSSQKINSMLTQTGTIQNQPIASFADGADDVPVSSLIVDINAVQAGSGDPSPSNVRPISGWSACKVTRTGSNLWDEEWEVGGYNTSTGAKTSVTDRIRSKNNIVVRPNVTYCIRAGAGGGSVLFYGIDGTTFLSSQTVSWLGGTTFTTPSNCYFVTFMSYANYGTTYNHDISINYPATDTAYHASNDDAWEISLYETVYGGTLDVVKGVLTIDRAIADLGDWNYTYNSTHGFFYTNMPADSADNISGGQEGICSCYKLYQGNLNGFKATDNAFTYNNSSIGGAKTIGIRDTATTDASVLKTNLTGQKLVYKLSTPIVVNNLHPEIVKTLAGNNNIFADTGNINKLVYFKAGSETIARLIEAYLRGE